MWMVSNEREDKSLLFAQKEEYCFATAARTDNSTGQARPSKISHTVKPDNVTTSELRQPQNKTLQYRY